MRDPADSAAQAYHRSVLWLRRLWLRHFGRLLIPQPVRFIIHRLEKNGHGAYVVGGCVRDLLLGMQPGDWDVATSAPPDEVRRLFARTIPTGFAHGTVTVVEGGLAVEVTTFRLEGGYDDHRHPGWVEFSPRIEDDLARRDFTINAMALDHRGVLLDPFGGMDDLATGCIRAVGDPAERFGEDALRMLRAARFSSQLGFVLHPETESAVRENVNLLRHVSAERIQAEVVRTLMSDDPARGFHIMQVTGLLDQFWPELRAGVGLEQNVHHAYTVWEHSLLALNAMARLSDDLSLRLAALLHDVAKPECLSTDEQGKRHFYNHQVVGAAMARRMLERLRFDKKTIARVVHLIRHHMALHHYPEMKDAGIRRLIHRVGVDSIRDLITLRAADREGSGTKGTPLSRGTLLLLQRIEHILEEDAAFGLKDLAVDGRDVMRVAGIPPGPMVGDILETLLQEVLENPDINHPEVLEGRIRQMVEERDAVTSVAKGGQEHESDTIG